jgi:hypothetical protein
LFGYLPLGGAGDANISARQTIHLSGPYFQFVMRSGIISAIKKPKQDNFSTMHKHNFILILSIKGR